MRSGTCVLLAILAAGTAWAVDDSAAIQSVIEAQLAFTQVPGAAKINPEIYAPDAVCIWGGLIHRKRESLVAEFEKYRKQAEKDFASCKFTLDKLEVRVTGDSAWATVQLRFEATTKEKKEVITRLSWSTFVFTKAGNSWQILHEHNSPAPLR